VWARRGAPARPLQARAPPTLVRDSDKSDEEVAVGHTLAHLTIASWIIR